MRNKYISIAAVMSFAAATALLFSWSFCKWVVPAYGASMVLLFLTAAAGTAVFALRKGRTKKQAIIRGIVTGALYTGFLSALTYLVNNVLKNTNKPWIAALTVTALNCLLWLCWGLRFSGIKSSGGQTEGKAGQKVLAVLLSLCLLVCGCLPLYGSATEYLFLKSGHREAVPSGLSTYTEKETVLVGNADLYVSPDGDDAGDGSFEHPLATLEKARSLVRETDKAGKNGIVVALKAGEYRIDSLVFTQEDSGTEDCPVTYCAYGDGEVILNGGVTMDPAVFAPVTDEEQLSRLSGKAQDHIVCADLGALGITEEDYGKIYAIGAYNTANFYDGDTTGPIWGELFVNDERYELARYPDSGWLETGSLRQVGYNVEGNRAETEDGRIDYVSNPVSDIYEIGQELADRINSWKTLDDVWMFGFWRYTWADGSTPIGDFDYEKRLLSPEYVSRYEAVSGMPYYFFNIFEELDAPGEWYLDRENNIMYLYAPENLENASIDLSLTTEPLLKGEGVHDLTFEGLTFKGTRGDAVTITGDRCTVSRCLIKNVAGDALIMEGYDNLAGENEITHTGKAAITIGGGDETTLTPGNSRADNNLIHDWSEVYQTYQPAVTLRGVGNICSHNEIYNSPHEAVTYYGNNHTIEYNVIHDVCLISDDAGAIYAGRSWTMYGTVIRYNCIYNLGTPGEHSPQGIYMDDALAGQTIYGNLLVNMPCFGLQLGGGRDLIAKNNIVINTSGPAVSFDQRAIDGILSGGWFDHCPELWKGLNNSPWQTEAWQSAWPQYKGLHMDTDRSDDPMFAPNAANGSVTGNLFVNMRNSIGDISDNPAKFSDISGNAVYRLRALKKLFVDPENGDYTLRDDSPVFEKIPGFENLPISEMGRY